MGILALDVSRFGVVMSADSQPVELLDRRDRVTPTRARIRSERCVVSPHLSLIHIFRDEFPSASEADLEGGRVVRVALWLTSVFLSFGFDLLATWLLSTCFQLILLPGLMVGQNLQNAASDARAAKSFEDTEKIVDALDTHTQGGLKDVLDAVERVEVLVKR